MQMNKRYDEVSGETLYSGTHKSGLRIYIIPKKDYNGTYAIFGTNYGSVNSEFIVPGETEVTKVPDGIAHYLEHKMFDQPDGSNVFEKFSKYGGDANAFTSFNITAYLFSCTSHFEKNLETLLDYVQSPHYTDETVGKEQGIIGQEIKMYDDNPDWQLFMGYIDNLYNVHPIKRAIAGTVESIAKITPEYLYKCYKTFYNLSNMALVIVGKVDIESALKVIDDGIKNNEPFNEPIKTGYPKEPDSLPEDVCHERAMAVASPMFMFGFKDNDTELSGFEMLKKNIEVTILHQMLFGKSSAIYKKLYDSGLINETFSVDYSMHVDYAFTSIDGESQAPYEVYDTVLNELESLGSDGLSEEDFERIKKVIWGKYIRSQNDIEDYGSTFLQMLFMGIDYFDYYKAYKSVTFSDVKNRFDKLFKRENSAIMVIKPL